MPLVLSERDYKLLTLFTKVAGVFTFAGGLVTLVDHRSLWGLLLIVIGTVVTLAPVPMTVMRPDTYPADDEDDGQLSVNE
ncbi:MAG: hypothetical protein V4510_05475 [bacterium]